MLPIGRLVVRPAPCSGVVAGTTISAAASRALPAVTPASSLLQQIVALLCEWCSDAMPEGDTVFKIAGYLAERLTGRRIVSGMALMPETLSLSGRRIGSVVAQGKHLLIEFDDGSLLRSHLGLWGAWHRYAPDESRQKPRRQASILLETDEERVAMSFG